MSSISDYMDSVDIFGDTGIDAALGKLFTIQESTDANYGYSPDSTPVQFGDAFGLEANLDSASKLAIDSLDQYNADTSPSAALQISGNAYGNSGGTGLLSSVASLIEQNPNVAKLIAGAYSANKANEAAARSEEEKLRTRQRISDSIMGLTKMPSGNASPLTRLNGNRV